MTQAPAAQEPVAYSKEAKAILKKGGLVEDSKKAYEKTMKRFVEYLTNSAEIDYDGKRPFTSVDVVNYIANEANRVALNTLVSYVSHLKPSLERAHVHSALPKTPRWMFLPPSRDRATPAASLSRIQYWLSLYRVRHLHFLPWP